LGGGGRHEEHSGAMGALHWSWRRTSYGAQWRGIFRAKRGNGYGGSYPLVLGGGHNSMEASDGVLLPRSKVTGGGLLRWTSIQGVVWGGTQGLR
jgi:hypothetical protein